MNESYSHTGDYRHHEHEDREKPEADDEVVHEMLSSVGVSPAGFSPVKARGYQVRIAMSPVAKTR